MFRLETTSVQNSTTTVQVENTMDVKHSEEDKQIQENDSQSTETSDSHEKPSHSSCVVEESQSTCVKGNRQSIVRHQQEPLFHVSASSTIYCLIWFSVVLMHMLLGAYFIGLTLLYWYLPKTVLINWFIIYGVIIDPTGCPYVSAGYAIFGIINIILVIRLLAISVFARRFVLSVPPPQNAKYMSVRSLARAPRMTALSFRLRNNFIVTRVNAWVDKVLTKIFVSKQDQYETFYRFQKFVQSAIQFQQLYMASQTVSRMWIINAWATLLILNCFSTPVIVRLVKNDGAKQHLLSVALELLLDIASLLLQLILAIPYFQQYRSGITNFEPIQWYQDRWFVHAINEFQAMLVSSKVGLVSRLIIMASATHGLHTIAETMIRQNVKTTHSCAQNDGLSLSNVTPTVDEKVRVENTPPTLTTKPTRKTKTIRKDQVTLGNIATLLTVLLGAIAFVTHIVALSASHEEACVNPIYPWFASLGKSPCSFAQFNCQKYNYTGTAEQTTRFLDSFNTKYLALLVIRRCPALHVPPAIKTASHLLELKFVDCAINEWGEDAALTQTNHPHIRYTAIANTTMTAFPQGLTSSDFPPALADIEMCRSPITGPIPDTLDSVWPSDAFVVMEEMNLTQVPPVLTRINPWAISFANNQLTSIPDGIVTNDHTTYTILNGNPLTALPNVEAVGASFTMVNISGTYITTIPKAYAHLTIAAWGTTLCSCGKPICECNPPQCEESLVIECFDPHGNYTMFPINVEHSINPA